MVDERKVGLYRLKNRNPYGARVVYNANKQPVHLDPGEERETVMTENMVRILRQRHSDVVAQRVGGVEGRPHETFEDVPRSAPEDVEQSPPTRQPVTERMRVQVQRDSVVIPEDWKDLDWPVLRRLAAKLSDDPVKNRKDAEASIRAELKRRGE